VPRVLRIAYLTGRYPAMTPTFVLREVAELRACGVDIETFSIWRTPPSDLLAPDDRAEAERTTSLLPPSAIAGVRSLLAALVRSPAGMISLMRGAFRLARPGARGKLLAMSWVLEALLLWSELRRRGIRHVHVHLMGTAPAVALLATDLANRIEGQPRHTWSLTIHGPVEFYDVHNDALAEKVAAAEFAVCISDFGRSQVMAFVDRSCWPKVHVVHCGLDAEQTRRTAPPAPAEGRPVRMLTVCKLSPRKGVAILLEATRDLVDAGVDLDLTVVGDGPQRGELEQLCLELGIGERVTFAGAVGQDRIAEFYEAADLFAMSSFAEGIPVVLMEAMAYELPVVAPATMGVPELVESDRTGLLFRPGRTDQLSDAVGRLARDAELRQRLGAAGRQKVAAEFDIRDSAARLRELFEAIA
jgi:glycosyltransferase involved in cell wall biosynthesis